MVWARVVVVVVVAWDRVQAPVRATDQVSDPVSARDSDLAWAQVTVSASVPPRAAPAHPPTALSRYGASTRR